MSTYYNTLLIIISFNQQELQDFLETIFENIFCLKYSDGGFRIFLFKNCLYISIGHEYCGFGQDRKAGYIADRNDENQEIVLMYPSFCMEFWIWRVMTKRITKEGFFSGDKAPYLGQGGPKESVIDLSIQGKCVDISDKIYAMYLAKELEANLKKIQEELDSGKNELLDEKYSDSHRVEDILKNCLTDDYIQRKEGREKAEKEWETIYLQYRKEHEDNLDDTQAYWRFRIEYKKENPFPEYIFPKTLDVDMDKAHRLLEDLKQGAWKKRTNIEAFIDKFGTDYVVTGPAESNKKADEELKKRDLIQKEKQFFQTNFAFTD